MEDADDDECNDEDGTEQQVIEQMRENRFITRAVISPVSTTSTRHTSCSSIIVMERTPMPPDRRSSMSFLLRAQTPPRFCSVFRCYPR